MENHIAPAPYPPDSISLLREGSLIETRKCGSGAYRVTRIWQNLMLLSTLTDATSRLPTPQRPAETALRRAGLNTWSTHPIPSQDEEEDGRFLPLGHVSAEEPLPRLGTHPNASHIRALGGPLGRGIVYEANRPTPPTAEV